MVKHILKNKDKMFTFKNIMLLVIFVFVTVLVYNVKYLPHAPLIIYLAMIICYKFIFKLEINKAILVVGIIMCLYFVADVIVTVIFLCFFTAPTIRSDPFVFLLSNVSVALILFIMTMFKKLMIKLNNFFYKIENNKYCDRILFIILMIIVFSFIIYNITTATTLSKAYLINILIMFIFFALTFIFISEKNQRDQLNNEYDTLMEYVHNFEDWIEEEGLNRHESKNQLAIIREMVKNNKKAVEYIDDILKDRIYVDDSWINEIKHLPSGGIKGLLYYKLILTKKENIDICLNVSRDTKNFISDVSKTELNNIYRLLGIYIDNAIEAAKESENKMVSIEIYPLKNKLIIVISNAYKGNISIKTIKKKGYSTKGKGHGNGLYYAEKIIKKSDLLEGESSVINNYYIQKIIITK